MEWNYLIQSFGKPGNPLRRAVMAHNRVRHNHGSAVATKIFEIFEVAVRGHLRKSEGPPPPRTLTQKVPFKLRPLLY